jgi:hypothetical protein
VGEVVVGTRGEAMIHGIPEDVGEVEETAETAETAVVMDTLLDRTITPGDRL